MKKPVDRALDPEDVSGPETSGGSTTNFQIGGSGYIVTTLSCVCSAYTQARDTIFVLRIG